MNKQDKRELMALYKKYNGNINKIIASFEDYQNAEMSKLLNKKQWATYLNKKEKMIKKFYKANKVII
jgi:hypothetical protein